MAAQQNKPQEVTVNLKAEVQKLKELRDAISDLKKEGKLANTNENTYKALFNQIEQAIKRMNEAVRDGTIGASGLKSIQKGFISITESIAKMVSQEKSTGQGMKQYLKDLEDAQKKVDTLQNKIKSLQKDQSNLNVTEKGNVKKGQEGAVMATAREKSRKQRDNKGADTKAEALLKGGDLKAIQAEANNGNKDAQKALALYNAELKLQHDNLQVIIDDLEEYKEKLVAAKADLNQIQSSSAFHEDAVQQLEEAGKATDQTRQSLEDLGDSMEKTGTSSIKVSNDMKKTESSTSKAAKSFIKFNVVLKVAKSLFKQGIESVVEMDKALTDMAIVTGRSRDELYQMVPTFNKLGRATGATATEVAGLTAEYMKQGRTMQDSLELAEQTAKAAKISGISTAESVEYMTAAINGFNLAAKDAEHVSDVFAKLGAATATDYKDLAIALSKVSAQANTAGMSMEFTTALLAKGLEVTQEAPESIGTALKTVIARMREMSDYGATLEDNVSVNKMENALKAVGVELRDTNGQFRDLEEIFNELGPKWSSLNTMQQQAVAQAAAGTRQQSRFLAIMQDWDRTVEISNAALDAEGATMYQSAKYAESLEFSINELRTAWQGFVEGLTDSDLVRDVFSVIAKTISGVADAIEWLNKYTGGIVGTFVTMAVPMGIILQMAREKLDIARKEKEIRDAEYNRLQQEAAGGQSAKPGTPGTPSAPGATPGAPGVPNAPGAVVPEGQYDTLSTAGEKYNSILERMRSTVLLIGQGFATGWNENLDISEQKLLRNLEHSERLQNEIEMLEGRQKSDGFDEKRQAKIQKLKAKQAQADEKTEKQLIKVKNKNLVKEEKQLAKKQKKNEKAQKKEQAYYEKIVKQKGKDSKEAEESLQRQYDLEADNYKILGQQMGVARDKQKNEDAIKKSMEEQGAAATANMVVESGNAVLTEAQEESEEDITKEKVKQNVAEGAEVVTNTTNTLLTKEQLKAERDKGKAIWANIGKKAGEIAANATASLAMIAGFMSNPITIGLAIAALAVLGTVMAVNAFGGKAAENTSAKVGEKQNAIYENKEKKAETDATLEEYEALYNKKGRTAEDNARLEEIEAELREKDKEDGTNKYTGKSGEELIKALKEESAALDAQIKKDIQDNVDYMQYRAGMMSNSEAKELLKTGEGRLAYQQLADQNARASIEELGVEDEYKQEILNAATGMFSSISDAEIDALVDAKGGKGAAEYLEEFTKKTADMAYDIAKASNDKNKTANENFINGIEAYNKAIAEAGDDEILKDALKTQYREYALLSGATNELAMAMDKGALPGALTDLAKKFSDLGYSTDALKLLLDKVYDDSNGGKVTAANLDKMTDDEWRQFSGKSEEDWAKMSDSEKQAMKNKAYEEAKAMVAGIRPESIQETRTGLQSAHENTLDIKEALTDGGQLTQEQEEYLRDNYAGIYGSQAYKDAKASGDMSSIVDMIEAEEAKTKNQKADSMQKMADEEKADFARQMEQAGLDNFDYEAYLKGDRELTAEQKALADSLAANIQYYEDSAEAVRNFEFQYEGLNAEEQKRIENEEQLEALQKNIDKRGLGTLAEYAEMQRIASEMQADAQSAWNKTKASMDERFKGVLEYNEATGTLGVNMAEYAKLSASEKKAFDEKLETLKEQNEVLEEQKDKVEEIAQMQRDNAIEIQNKAIEAMQARLDAEYEATQKSLEKRQELYSKYFDELDSEEEEANYETDRQALLNKIAALSTSTDSESLAKLKEAQEALQELDEGKLESDREMRREAVEQSFEDQNAALDAAYDEAMNNVEGLWQEFISMQKEDQEALFKQYGDEFQNVTALAAEAATENLSNFLDAVEGRGIMQPDGTVHKYAEGGLVDFTGPAWVDGSKSAPEAFLDPEDTANIGMLAQGLRSMVSGIFNPQSNNDAAATSDSTVSIENLNINLGASGLLGAAEQAGKNVANGFLDALSDLGININKRF